jgi:hypothetical protein
MQRINSIKFFVFVAPLPLISNKVFIFVNQFLKILKMNKGENTLIENKELLYEAIHLNSDRSHYIREALCEAVIQSEEDIRNGRVIPHEAISRKYVGQ